MVRRASVKGVLGALVPMLLAPMAVALPAQAGEALIGLEQDGRHIISFDSNAPDALFARLPLLEAAEGGAQPIAAPLTGIDFDPDPAGPESTDGALHAFGSDGRIYVIDPTNGGVRALGDGMNVDSRLAGSAAVGFDVAPDGDSARVVDSADNSARYELPGGTASEPLGGKVTPAGSGISALASSGSDLFGIAAATDKLVTVGDDGTISERGPIAVGFDVTPAAGFDILGSSAFAALSGGSGSTLYDIDLTTGAATGGKPIRTDAPLSGLAIAPAGSIQLQTTAVSVSESGRFANLTVERNGGDLRPAVFYFATIDKTARRGEDYTRGFFPSGFAQGQRTVQIQVPIIDDRLSERPETFFVALGLPGNGAILGLQRLAVVAIFSNDEGLAGPPKASFDLVRALRPASKGARFNFICNEPCGVRSDLKLDNRIIGSGEAVGGTSPRPLNVRFTGAGTRRLRKVKPKDRLRLVTRVTDRQGQRKVVKTRVRVS